MSVNNQMFNLFKDMKQGYANDNMDVVEQCARCWLQLAPENPFTYDTPEYDLFFNMQRSYMIWSRGDIDQKINRRKMVQYAKALCALNPKQPYTFDKKAEQEEKKQRELEAQAIKVVVNEQPQTILGIVPEEETEKEQEKENKSWFKFLFPWKKESENNDSK